MFKEAADMGHPRAQLNYGFARMSGEEIDLNRVEASKYFKMSADQGDPLAQYNYALCLKNGDGVLTNEVDAAKYFKLAADQDDALSQFAYGLCLLGGEGVAANQSEAAKYLVLAIENNVEAAREVYEDLLSTGARLDAGPLSKLPIKTTLAVSDTLMGFEEYVEQGVIDAGPNGFVFALQDPDTGVVVASKLFTIGPRFDHAKFTREIGRSFKFDHPLILSTLAVRVPFEGFGPRIVTPYMQNGSVQELIERMRAGEPPSYWNPTNVVKIITGIILGMMFLHSQGVIHLDLKPSNLLIDEECNVKISDVGTARLEECGCIQAVRKAPLYYKAPELWDEGPVTEKADVFAFGVILYEILISGHMFSDDVSELEVMRRMSMGTRPVLEEEFSELGGIIIEQCWAVNPQERPSFADILEIVTRNGFAFVADVDEGLLVEFVRAVTDIYES
jgi:hypothetical protein